MLNTRPITNRIRNTESIQHRTTVSKRTPISKERISNIGFKSEKDTKVCTAKAAKRNRKKKNNVRKYTPKMYCSCKGKKLLTFTDISEFKSFILEGNFLMFFFMFIVKSSVV